MKYTKIKNRSYNLHIIKTDRFKTITIQINFKRKTVKEDITIRNMIANMLCDSNSVYKTPRELEIATEELYNLFYTSTNYMSGKYSVMALEFTFLNEKYTEKGMLNKSLEFIHNIIFKPNIIEEDGIKKFNLDSYNISYNQLKNRIESIKENPAYYARIRMLEELDKNSYVSYRSTGYMEDLEKINNTNLYDYYMSMLDSDIIDIFVIGDVNSSQIERAINDKFKGITESRESSDSHFVKAKKPRKLLHVVKEKLHINQSKLMIGCTIDDMTDFELRYVLNVYSFILGGSPDSKLFNNVREKHSLCYHISSSAAPIYSIFTITAGINKKDFRKTLKLIKKEIKNMKDGKFTNEDVVKAKVTYINSLKELEDNPSSIIGLYSGIEYLNSDTIEDRLLKINKVTLNDVKLLARKIHMDTVYLLEGDIREKKTN